MRRSGKELVSLWPRRSAEAACGATIVGLVTRGADQRLFLALRTYCSRYRDVVNSLFRCVAMLFCCRTRALPSHRVQFNRRFFRNISLWLPKTVAMQNDTCHFLTMNDQPYLEDFFSAPQIPKVGRPRRATEVARRTALLDAATRVFLREGDGLASMDKIVAEAGASTRTLYERFKNRAELLAAVINRMLERLAKVLATADLDRLEPHAALTVIADTMVTRACDSDCAASFRITATESHRFPELAAKMRVNDKRCVDNLVANYCRSQIKRGKSALPDSDKGGFVVSTNVLLADARMSVVWR